MKPTNAPHSQHPAPPAPRRLPLRKETLRRLTPAALRLAAGGFGDARPSNNPTNCSTSRHC